MDANRLVAMRTVAFNLLSEGQASRADCVMELCNEIERLQQELELCRKVKAQILKSQVE